MMSGQKAKKRGKWTDNIGVSDIKIMKTNGKRLERVTKLPFKICECLNQAFLYVSGF